MNFLDLNDDVKVIISKNLQSDCKILTMLSKYDDLQKILVGEIVFDDDFCKILKLQNDVKENDDFKNAKIYKIYKDINDVVYIGSTCDTLKNCMSKFRIKSKSRVNWSYDKFYMHVCMYVCMYVSMYVSMYVCIIRMYVCMYVCMYLCIYKFINIYIYIYT